MGGYGKDPDTLHEFIRTNEEFQREMYDSYVKYMLFKYPNEPVKTFEEWQDHFGLGRVTDDCSNCGSTRKECEKRAFAHPRWCCPKCIPDRTHGF